MKNRVISALLILSLCTALSACGSDGVTSDTSSDSASTDTAPSYPAGIEPENNENAPFHILAPNWGLYPNYFFANEDSKADAMGQALYNRELAVEEHLGIDITSEITATIENIYPAVQQMVMSGDNTYQLVLAHCINGINGMLLDELLLDLTTTTIDFDAAWWNQNAVEALKINDSVYFALSDYMLSDPNAFLFNKTMIDEYDLEDPYELVRNGEWTLDKLTEMASKITKDNGDGIWNKDDTYGFTTPDDWFLTDFIYSSDITLLKTNDDGEFELSYGGDRTVTLFEKLDKLFNGPDCFEYPFSATTDLNSPNRFSIESGRCLFTVYSLNQLHLLRDTTVDFGILPYPKLDAEQDGYHTLEWSGLMCVPSTVENPELVGKAIELLSYYSTSTTVPAYFNLVLGEKLSRDTDSKEMLEIIFDGIVVDAGVNYLRGKSNMNSLFLSPASVSRGSIGGFSSFFATYKQGVESEIQEFNDAVSAME